MPEAPPPPAASSTEAAPPGPAAGEPDDQLPEQLRVRREKRERLLASGVEAYPVSVPRSASLAQVRAAHAGLAAGEETDAVVSVAGRVVSQRVTGKLAFATLQDGDGTRLQVMLSLAEVGPEALAAWKSDVDLGDVVSATGRVVQSKRDELSVMATSWVMATKSLRPLPELYDGLETSEETRVRQRYVDLIVRPEARDGGRARAPPSSGRCGQRSHERGYLELETPMLQTLHGGAAARPFVTRSNAFDLDLYLRIAPELFLKRAVVGGPRARLRDQPELPQRGRRLLALPGVRDAGVLRGVRRLRPDGDERPATLVQGAARAALGTEVAVLADGSEYDLSGEWTSLSMYPSLSAALGEEVTPQTPRADLRRPRRAARSRAWRRRRAPGKLVEEVWEHLVGDHLVAPTFVRDFPLETSPLTKSHRSVPGVVEKWDLYVRGFELATGYSELNDPVVQRERLEAQARLAAAGDDEAMAVDEDFLRAMEMGCRPRAASGWASTGC